MRQAGERWWRQLEAGVLGRDNGSRRDGPALETVFEEEAPSTSSARLLGGISSSSASRRVWAGAEGLEFGHTARQSRRRQRTTRSKLMQGLVAGATGVLCAVLLLSSLNLGGPRATRVLYLDPAEEAAAGAVMLEDSGCGEFVCPGSPAFVHASAKVVVDADAPCADVRAEMLARVEGQADGGWSDPHNKGTYTLLSESTTSSGRSVLVFKRRTGDDRFTDKMAFVLEASHNSCIIRGCSESQVTSVGDFSTNLCNLHNLYCGSSSDPSCATVKHDFVSKERHIIPSIGAGTNIGKCKA